MSSQEVERKLAAILSADVKGYSRLMGEDEKGTVQTLNAYKGVMTGLVQQHHGRVVDAPGDNVLAEFGSVVDAVECAVKIQKEHKTQNAKVPENRKMEFRIGVNLGDVIEDGEQILGDGVNIAARLESLSRDSNFVKGLISIHGMQLHDLPWGKPIFEQKILRNRKNITKRLVGF